MNSWRYEVLIPVSRGYPSVWGRLPTRYSPVRRSQYLHSTEVSFQYLPLDLHVLGTPPAFILSQDQTLNKWYLRPERIQAFKSCSVKRNAFRFVSNFHLHIFIWHTNLRIIVFLFLKNCTLTPSNKFEFVLPIIADCICTFSFLRSVKISLTKFLHYVVIKVQCLNILPDSLESSVEFRLENRKS